MDPADLWFLDIKNIESLQQREKKIRGSSHGLALYTDDENRHIWSVLACCLHFRVQPDWISGGLRNSCCRETWQVSLTRNCQSCAVTPRDTMNCVGHHCGLCRTEKITPEATENMGFLLYQVIFHGAMWQCASEIKQKKKERKKNEKKTEQSALKCQHIQNELLQATASKLLCEIKGCCAGIIYFHICEYVNINT